MPFKLPERYVLPPWRCPSSLLKGIFYFVICKLLICNSLRTRLREGISCCHHPLLSSPFLGDERRVSVRMHQLTAYIITVERQTGILPLERGGGGGDDITATYKQLRAFIIPSYPLLSKGRKGGCLYVCTRRYSCLTSPGAIPNSSLKHLAKYEGAVKPTS